MEEIKDDEIDYIKLYKVDTKRCEYCKYQDRIQLSNIYDFVNDVFVNDVYDCQKEMYAKKDRHECFSSKCDLFDIDPQKEADLIESLKVTHKCEQEELQLQALREKYNFKEN